MNIKHAFINLTDPVVFQSFGGEAVWEKIAVPAGTTIVTEGGESQDFYYILSGTVTVSKRLEGEAHKTLATLTRGDFFGEGALLSDQRRGASVLATTDVELLKLSQKQFETLVQSDATAAAGLVLGLAKVLNARLREMNERLVVLSNVAHLSSQHGGDRQKVIPAIFAEVAKAVGHADFAFYGMDGLAQFTGEGASAKVLEAFQMHIPDYAHRLQVPGSAGSIQNEDQLYCAVRDRQGQVCGVLAAMTQGSMEDQDRRLFITLAEQMGHVFDGPA